MSVNEVCCNVRIYGTVQMVWYRAWTVEKAEKRGLSGWVRNRKDGTVEALFWGRAKAVEEMLAACRDGPPNAEVADIVTSPAEPPGKRGFFNLPTE